MVRKDLISQTASVLRENNIRKAVSIPKHVLHVSDDYGHTRDFPIKEASRMVLYTAEDVEAILDACRYVIQEAIKRGEEVSIFGFGRLGLKYRKGQTVRNVLDGERVDVEGHFVPRFTAGNDLRRCAQVYEQSVRDMEINAPPVFEEEE